MNSITSHRRAMCRMSARTASMELTSRNIRIGIATVPRQRIEITADADMLQAALLHKAETADRYVGWVLAVCGLAVAVMAWAGLLPGAGA